MKNTLLMFLVLALIGALNFGPYHLLKVSGSKAPPTVEGFLLLESEAGKKGEYSLGMSRTMSDCRNMGNLETGPDLDGHWVDPTFSQLGSETDGRTYFMIAGFVCRQHQNPAQP